MVVLQNRSKMLAGLEKRLITALVLGLIVIGITLSGSVLLFSLLLALFISLGAWEWLGLSRVSSRTGKTVFPAAVLLSMLFFYLFHAPVWDNYLTLGGVLVWCLGFVMVITYQLGRPLIPDLPFMRLVIGVIILLPAWINLFVLYNGENGIERVLLFFILIWLVDSSAYFVGSSIGRHQLASKVSPGKSWEGFWGAMVAAILLAFAYSSYAGIYDSDTRIWLVILFMITMVFSVIGDLFISMFKRSVHLKDTSSLLPGHGGVLDRVDSLLAAAPVYVFGFNLLGDRL